MVNKEIGSLGSTRVTRDKIMHELALKAQTIQKWPKSLLSVVLSMIFP